MGIVVQNLHRVGYRWKFPKVIPPNASPFVDGKLTEFVRWLGHATLEQRVRALEGAYEKKVLIDQVVYVDVA